jgi:hypothetical protein
VKYEKPKKPWSKPEVKKLELNQEQRDRLLRIFEASSKLPVNK